MEDNGGLVLPGEVILKETVKPGTEFCYRNATSSTIGVIIVLRVDGGALRFNVPPGQRFEFRCGACSDCTVILSDPLSLDVEAEAIERPPEQLSLKH
jgi:hypothetical protein